MNARGGGDPGRKTSRAVVAFGSFLLLILGAGGVTVRAQAAPAATADSTSSRTRVVSPYDATTDNPPPPGQDAEHGPISFGEQLRLWTPLTQAEIDAVDPSFRKWVDLIRTGQADKRVMRLYWYYRTRLDPFDKPIPAGWRDRGIAVLRDIERSKAALRSWSQAHPVTPAPSGESPAPASTFSGSGISPYGVWVPIGPFTIPGRTTGLDRPGGQTSTLYAAVADGGVWRTMDGAAHWELLTPLEATQSGGAILLDPGNPSVIYFGTGEGNGAIDNYGGVGVLKSTDGGKTWVRSNAFSGSIRRLAMHPSEPSRIYAAGDSGCYLSTDAGATFNLIATGGLPTNAGASDVLVRPDDPNKVFCAIWGGANGGIYRSLDHGATWTILSNGLPAMGTVARISLGISKSSPNVMLAGIDQSNGTIYKTSDGGDSWTTLGGGSTGYCGGQCWYDNTVAIDSADPTVMYAGGISHWRSLDGGATWAVSDAGVHVDHHFTFTPAPGEVLAASDGGIHHSADKGGSWSDWSVGMDTTQYYGICRNAADPYWAAGGTQDNGSERRRLSDGWVQVLGGDGGMCMTGPPGSNIVLGEYQNMNIQRSTDDATSWFPANGGIPSNDPHPWVGIIVADPSNRNNMWAGTNKVYRSLDARASNWVRVSTALYFSLDVTALEVAPTDSNTVYAGFDAGGIYVSTNALSATPTWTSIRASNMPQRGVRRIRAHPTTVGTVYAVISGYGTGKLWKSTNAGGAWVEITGDLPDVPVNDMVIDAANPGTLIASTDLGVFRSDNDGAHWYGWSPGLPTVASIEMTYDSTVAKLRLGTHGQSLWEWQPSSVSPTAVPDGGPVPGTEMTADRIGATDMRVQWDVRTCTARDYNLFWGDLAQVSSYAYSGADCGLGTSGLATVPIPSTVSGNVFFFIASSDGSGNEGPHSFTANGTPTQANGLGYCGITAQITTATCP